MAPAVVARLALELPWMLHALMAAGKLRAKQCLLDRGPDWLQLFPGVVLVTKK